MNDQFKLVRSYYLLALGGIILDQITKILAKTYMTYGEPIRIIGDFFRLTYIENPGMAFGIQFGGRWFFAIFSLIASIGIGWYLYHIRKSHPAIKTALALILSGAIGNMIDRFLYGRVADFFDMEFIDIPAFSLGNFHFSGMTRWPIYNIADACVSIGMVVLLYYTYVNGEELQPREATSTESE